MQDNNSVETVLRDLLREVREINRNISRLSNAIQLTKENNNKQTEEFINIASKNQTEVKQIGNVLKDIAEKNISITPTVQPENKTFCEQESLKLKTSSMISVWNTKIVSRSKHYWQIIRRMKRWYMMVGGI